MKQFTIRITDIDETARDKFIDYHKGLISFGVEEVGEKTGKVHFQSLFESDSKLDSHQKRARRYELRGNGDFSIKELHNYEGWLNYLCKGESLGKLPKVLINTLNLSDEEIERRHRAEWAHKASKKEAELSVSSSKEKKAQKKERVYEILWKQVYDNRCSIETPRDIAVMIFRYYLDNDKCEPSEYYIKQMSMSLYTKLFAKCDPENLKNFLSQRAYNLIPTWNISIVPEISE